MQTNWVRISLVMLALAGCKREVPAPATKPATQASTAPKPKPPTTSYVQVIQQHYPKFPSTQPLDSTVDLRDAGHYLLPEPIYLCPRGDLWITRDDAPPTPEVLARADKEQIHVTRERVLYVDWAADDEGKPLTRAVIRAISGDDAWVVGDRMFSTSRRDYRWDRALIFGEQIVVPTARGVSMFSFSSDPDKPEPKETYQEIVSASDASAAHAPTTIATTTIATQPASAGPDAFGVSPVQILLDPRGVLAWSPWENGRPGGNTVWRYVDGKWTDLGASNGNWAAHFLHLVPLLDGSVLQIIQKEGAKIGLALSPVDAPQIDETVLDQLIDQLSDDDPDKREAAYAQLTRYGPPSWPILEKKRDDQPPEARVRIEQLLRNRIAPTLGGRALVDGTAKLVTRFDDGGILLYSANGVSIPRQDKAPEIVKPAWISIRPGKAIELVDPVVVKEATPEKQHIFAFDNEWIVADSVQGPRRLFGNHLEPMLNKDEAAYINVIGYDRRGRWLFTKPGDDRQTMVLDPTLPDPTPRLPVWLMVIDHGSVGWTADGWPVIKRGGAWVLIADGWRPLDDKKEKMLTKAVAPDENVLITTPRPVVGPMRPRGMASTMPATTMATTREVAATTEPAIATTEPVASTQPTSAPVARHRAVSTQPDGAILVDRDGRRYFDGQQSLRVIDKDGKTIDWPLPANAVGAADFAPVLLRTADGTLFLLNAPGRVVRIKRTPDGTAPFVVEAVFTHRIPSSDRIMRIWLDPAERIVIAYENNRMAILFPAGRIPSHIATMIPAKEMEQQP